MLMLWKTLKKSGVHSLLFLTFLSSEVLLAESPDNSPTNSDDRTIEDVNADLVEQGAPPYQKIIRNQGFDFQMMTGLAHFQDVQLPAVGFMETRADGTEAGAERVGHTGIPIGIAGTYWGQMQKYRYQFGGRLTHVSSQTGPKETINASYNSMALQAALERNLASSYMLGLDSALVRENFKNVSTGHIVKSWMVGGRAGYRVNPDYAISGGMAVSPWGRLAYDGGKGFWGQDLAQTQVQSRVFYLESLMTFDPFTAVSLRFQQNTHSIQMKDILAYEAVGLSLRGLDSQEQTFVLQTSQLFFSFIKKF